MSRKVITSKKIFHSILLFILVILTSSFALILYSRSELVFKANNSILDLNNDGFEDKVSIEEKKNSYSIKISTKSKDYFLIPKENKPLGEISPSFPLQIYYYDLNRDLVPEILTIGRVNNSPCIHIFKWNKTNFTEVFYDNNNLFGLINSSNTKTPIFISLSSKKGDESTKNYILDDCSFKDISHSKIVVPGLRQLQLFINIVELSYELSETPDIFKVDIDKDELSTLWQLSKENFNYSFQYGFFKDLTWTPKGDINSLSWDLSFDKSFKSSGDKPSSELKLSIKIVNTNDGFKISSITKGE